MSGYKALENSQMRASGNHLRNEDTTLGNLYSFFLSETLHYSLSQSVQSWETKMKQILKNIAAVLLGFIAASAVMMLVETINGKVFYPDLAKAAEGIKDREAMRALFAGAPVGSLLVVAFGWFMGSAAGCWLCRKITASQTPLPPSVLILSTLLVLAGVANNLMMPPPLWFWITGIAALLIGAFLGSRAVRK